MHREHLFGWTGVVLIAALLACGRSNAQTGPDAVALGDDWLQRVQASKFKEWPRYGREPKGHIALQDHGDRVAFRNIRIRSPQ